VKGLINDPSNAYLVYLFVIDKNDFNEFRVFKINFNTSKLDYLNAKFSSSSSISVNSVIRRTFFNGEKDFLFVGKFMPGAVNSITKSLIGYSFVKKANTTDSDCLYFNTDGFAICFDRT